MTGSKTEKELGASKIDPGNGEPKVSKMPVFFLVLLIISIVGYFSLEDHWMEYVFAHSGGLSIVGLFACLAGTIARKKGYGYRKAFYLAFLLPIIVGVLVVFLSPSVACGGSISLGIALITVVLYSLVRQRDVLAQT